VLALLRSAAWRRRARTKRQEKGRVDMKCLVLSLFIVCCLSLFQSMAEAQLPNQCSSATNTRAFRAGRMAGSSLVRQSWASLNDCDRVEQFEDLVTSSLERYVPGNAPTLYTQCRFAGVVQGVLDELDTVFVDCTDACFREGKFAGEISAFAYCELSIALNGLETADDFLRGPVQVCGFSFEVGCDSEFIAVASSYENELGACEPFTVNTFVEVFDQARENQCAYNPLDPEEPEVTDEQQEGSGS